MNKPKSKFSELPEQDRRFILDLCAKHPYDDVVERLKKRPSDGGLGIATSSPALCRFYTRHIDENSALLVQSASAANVRHEQQSNAFLGAILSSVQARIFESLAQGKALADLHNDFKLLKTAQNLYLADAQWRAGNPKASRASYQNWVDRSARAPEVDFMSLEELDRRPEDAFCFDHRSVFEHDIVASRERQQRAAERNAELLARLTAAAFGPENPPAPAPANHSVRVETVSPRHPDAKSPIIPHIPPDSTSASGLEAPQKDPSSSESAAPVPFIRVAPKIGRNDACPCGSGRKFKKCCAGKSSPPANVAA